MPSIKKMHNESLTSLSAFAAERRAVAPLLHGRRRQPLSIDISCPRGDQQQTRRTAQRLSNDGTDGRTGTRPLHRPCSAYYARSVNNAVCARLEQNRADF